jgi:hypothetical protein
MFCVLRAVFPGAGSYRVPIYRSEPFDVLVLRRVLSSLVVTSPQEDEVFALLGRYTP